MKVAILILSGDSPEILFKCLTGIKLHVNRNYKIYLGYNGNNRTTEAEIREFLAKHFQATQYAVVKYDFYNFAILNNDLVRNHIDPDIDTLLFCNNDVILPGDCVDVMIELLTSSPIALGTIGCRLLHADHTIQHDGQVFYLWKNGLFRSVTHLNWGAAHDSLEYRSIREVVGNTFALCLCKLTTFHAVGGLNEEYTACFEDVEFNLRCLQEGYKNLILPSRLWAYHLESYSRKQSQEKGLTNEADVTRVVRFFHERFMNGKTLPILTSDMPEFTNKETP